MAGTIPVQVSTDWAEVRDHWPALADLGRGIEGYAFQTRDWIDAWFATLGQAGGAEPLFVTLGAPGAPRAFLPFVVRRRHGLRVLEGFGDGTADYHAPLLAEGTPFGPAEAEAIWSALARGRHAPDVVHLDKAVAEIRGAPNPLLAWGARPYPMSGHVARLEGPWSAWFDRHFGRETQKTLARKRRKLGEFGAVETRFARDLPEALAWLDALIAGKAAQMQGAEIENGLAGSATEAFYETLTRASGTEGPVRLYALTVGGTPIALQWGVAAGDRFTNLLTSYLEGDWTRFSPGLLLFRFLLEDCLDAGVRTFDFGIGDEGYKARFSDDPAIVLNSIVRARSLRGRGYAAAQSARHHLRNARSVRWARQTLRGLSRPRADASAPAQAG